MKGAEEIAEMMSSYRQNPPASINGSPVVKIFDYQLSHVTTLATGEQTPIDLPEIQCAAVPDCGRQPDLPRALPARNPRSSSISACMNRWKARPTWKEWNRRWMRKWRVLFTTCNSDDPIHQDLL